MGIALYKEPMDYRLTDEKFYDFFRQAFEEDHRNDPPVLDDDTWDLAVRNKEYVDRIYEEYKKQL